VAAAFVSFSLLPFLPSSHLRLNLSQNVYNQQFFTTRLPSLPPSLPVLLRSGLKTYPYSKCPPILVPLVETEDVLAWTEEQLNHSVRVKQGEEGGREGRRTGTETSNVCTH
jgi:hypothetical protein